MKTEKGVEVPEDFARVLRKHPQALKFFSAMPPSHQREYVRYVEEAKKQETRERRAKRALEMILQWGEKRER